MFMPLPEISETASEVDHKITTAPSYHIWAYLTPKGTWIYMISKRETIPKKWLDFSRLQIAAPKTCGERPQVSVAVDGAGLHWLAGARDQAGPLAVLVTCED